MISKVGPSTVIIFDCLLVNHDGSFSTSWCEHISDQCIFYDTYAWILETGWLPSTHTWILCQLQEEGQVPMHSLPVLKPLYPFHAETLRSPVLAAPLLEDSESYQTGLQSRSTEYLHQCLNYSVLSNLETHNTNHRLTQRKCNRSFSISYTSQQGHMWFLHSVKF